MIVIWFNCSSVAEEIYVRTILLGSCRIHLQIWLIWQTCKLLLAKAHCCYWFPRFDVKGEGGLVLLNSLFLILLIKILSFSLLLINVNAVVLVITASQERYPTTYRTGQTLKDCETLIKFTISQLLLSLFLFTRIHCNCRNIQASGLDGPIPSRLDALTSLKDLSVSSS